MSQSVERALTILEALGERPQLIAELADNLGVHKTTALRLLQTLERHALVSHDSEHRYRLGGGLFALGYQALEQRDLRQVASDHLRALSELTRQAIHLATYENERHEVMYIDKIDGHSSIRLHSWIGKPAPLHCTGVAKAIVAFLPGDEREAIAHAIDYVRHTERTITDVDGFLAELERIRERGYATDNGEHEEFVRCIAAPIRDVSGQVVGSVSITSPAMVLDLDELDRFLPNLIETTSLIARELGWQERSGPARRT
jgi:DNA-binding IclR family transcriptional regulator